MPIPEEWGAMLVSGRVSSKLLKRNKGEKNANNFLKKSSVACDPHTTQPWDFQWFTPLGTLDNFWLRKKNGMGERCPFFSLSVWTQASSDVLNHQFEDILPAMLKLAVFGSRWRWAQKTGREVQKNGGSGVGTVMLSLTLGKELKLSIFLTQGTGKFDFPVGKDFRAKIMLILECR